MLGRHRSVGQALGGEKQAGIAGLPDIFGHQVDQRLVVPEFLVGDVEGDVAAGVLAGIVALEGDELLDVLDVPVRLDHQGATPFAALADAGGKMGKALGKRDRPGGQPLAVVHDGSLGADLAHVDAAAARMLENADQVALHGEDGLGGVLDIAKGVAGIIARPPGVGVAAVHQKGRGGDDLAVHQGLAYLRMLELLAHPEQNLGHVPFLGHTGLIVTDRVSGLHQILLKALPLLQRIIKADRQLHCIPLGKKSWLSRIKTRYGAQETVATTRYGTRYLKRGFSETLFFRKKGEGNFRVYPRGC